MPEHEREEMMRYLREDVGLDEDEIARRLRHDDLLLLHPERVYTFESRRGLRELKEASEYFWAQVRVAQEHPYLGHVEEMFYENTALTIEEIAKRVRKRLEEEEQE